jgi:hypothetical protein
LALEHLGDFIFHAQPNARQVRRQGVLPIFLACFDDTGDRPYEAGIVERIVQAAILIDCTLDHLLHVSRLGHINANAACLTALVSNHRDGFLGSHAIDISDDYASALTREGEGGCPPDTGCTTRYNDDFSGHEL